MTHRLTLTIAISLVSLALTACNDTYYNDSGNNHSGGSGYYPPPSHDASKKELMDNCKARIKDKVRQRLGKGAKIDWGKSNMYNSSRYEVTINGKGKARNHGRKHKLFYHCTMNRKDAWVRNARIDLDDDPAGNNGNTTNWNQKAIKTCKERIRYQASRNIHQQFSLEFTRQHVNTPAERKRHVTGEALLRNKHGQGRIAYDCKLHVNPLKLENAGYRWIKPLPNTGSGGSGSYEQGIGNRDATHRCQKSLKNRLKLFGYSRIRFPDSRVHNLNGKKMQVDIHVEALTEDGSNVRENYRCRINSRNGKVLDISKVR